MLLEASKLLVLLHDGRGIATDPEWVVGHYPFLEEVDGSLLALLLLLWRRRRRRRKWRRDHLLE